MGEKEIKACYKNRHFCLISAFSYACLYDALILRRFKEKKWHKKNRHFKHFPHYLWLGEKEIKASLNRHFCLISAFSYVCLCDALILRRFKEKNGIKNRHFSTFLALITIGWQRNKCLFKSARLSNLSIFICMLILQRFKETNWHKNRQAYKRGVFFVFCLFVCFVLFCFVLFFFGFFFFFFGFGFFFFFLFFVFCFLFFCFFFCPIMVSAANVPDFKRGFSNLCFQYLNG